MASAIWNCCRLGACSVYTMQACISWQCQFIWSHISRVHVCLTVNCHLHFWQNDRDLLRATAVTRGWNGYRNKSQHRKSTMEKKILPPFQQGFEPAFQSRVRCSNHWAIPDSMYERTFLSLYMPSVNQQKPAVMHYNIKQNQCLQIDVDTFGKETCWYFPNGNVQELTHSMN